MEANNTYFESGPLLPRFELEPQEPLLSSMSDTHLAMILPIVAYWGWGLMFHFFDTHNCFEKYRIHTPAEISQRNLVPMKDVIRCVLIQQSWQVVLGILFDFGPDHTRVTGGAPYDVLVWAWRLRRAAYGLSKLLTLAGIDLKSSRWKDSSLWSALIALVRHNAHGQGQGFGRWEILCAKSVYHFFVPACQFSVAIFIGDSWQYWMHRISHQTPWIYNNLHSVHHQVYCPYAFGAWYAHLAEAFVWDTIGTALALGLSGLTTRQTMWFTTLSVLKSVDDHCGYSLPFDPFQLLNRQNASYHDIHHQSFGMKTNFSQVYTTFWDSALNTQWKGENLQRRYELGRQRAERASKKAS